MSTKQEARKLAIKALVQVRNSYTTGSGLLRKDFGVCSNVDRAVRDLHPLPLVLSEEEWDSRAEVYHAAIDEFDAAMLRHAMRLGLDVSYPLGRYKRVPTPSNPWNVDAWYSGCGPARVSLINSLINELQQVASWKE